MKGNRGVALQAEFRYLIRDILIAVIPDVTAERRVLGGESVPW